MAGQQENYAAFNSRALVEMVGDVTDEALKATKIKQFLSVLAGRYFNWAGRKSLFTLHLGIKCCAIEMAAAATPRFDGDRFGVLFRSSPRQSDVLLVNGPISKKFADVRADRHKLGRRQQRTCLEEFGDQRQARLLFPAGNTATVDVVRATKTRLHRTEPGSEQHLDKPHEWNGLLNSGVPAELHMGCGEAASNRSVSAGDSRPAARYSGPLATAIWTERPRRQNRIRHVNDCHRALAT